MIRQIDRFGILYNNSFPKLVFTVSAIGCPGIIRGGGEGTALLQNGCLENNGIRLVLFGKKEGEKLLAGKATRPIFAVPKNQVNSLVAERNGSPTHIAFNEVEWVTDPHSLQ